jgi:3-oxoacyl-[acyl-carrier-protein] synthase III
MTRIYSRIMGTGSYLPARILTNAELEKRIETTSEWIVERTGIRERHIAAEGELTSDLAQKAAESALDAAAIDASEIELIVVATTTSDRVLRRACFRPSWVLPMVVRHLTCKQSVAGLCMPYRWRISSSDLARSRPRWSLVPKPCRG